jgi:hypothetical protein
LGSPKNGKGFLILINILQILVIIIQIHLTFKEENVYEDFGLWGRCAWV